MIKIVDLRFLICIVGMVLLCIQGTKAKLYADDSSGSVIEETDDFIIRESKAPRSKCKGVEVLFIVHAPIEKCFEIITDYDHYPAFMPHITRAVAVRDTVQKQKIYYSFDFKVGFVVIDYTLCIEKKCGVSQDTCSVQWTYVQGDLRDNHGSWLLVKDPQSPAQRTLLRYKLFIEPGFAIPAFVVQRLMTQSVPTMIKAICKRVEKE